jgi:hypothetical protein
LPVFTVNNAEEAESLISLACETNLDGEYIARELVHEQTIPNLRAFGDRLESIYNKYIVPEARKEKL